MANPNSIPFTYYQDIQIPDVSLKQQFYEYMVNGQFAEALQLLQNNSQLNSKAFVANVINKVITGITTLENYYFSNVPLYLTNLANTYFSMISQWRNKGVWSSSIQYKVGNFVIYNSQIYYCFNQPPINTIPTNTSYWVLLGLQGAQGEPGIDVIMQYQWNPNNNYKINDLVVYNDIIYVAIQDNNNKQPDISNSDWIVFLQIDRASFYVNTEAPANPGDGQIWFKTDKDINLVTDTLGQFFIYDSIFGNWEEMYPNILFNWISDIDNYIKTSINIPITINNDFWSNNIWTYNDFRIVENTLVEVWLNSNLTNQINLFNSLSLNVQNGSIEFLKPENISTIPLDIIVKLYN